MDTPLTLDHAVNMAGLIQATAHWLLTKRPFKHQERDYLLYKFNRFQACRFGMAGIITDVNTGDGCRLSDDTLRLLENVASLRIKWARPARLKLYTCRLKMIMMKHKTCVTSSPKAESLSGLVKKHCEIWAGL
jgi:carboxylate-amine ligase